MGRRWQGKGIVQLGQNFPSGSCAGQERGIGGQTGLNPGSALKWDV